MRCGAEPMPAGSGLTPIRKYAESSTSVRLCSELETREETGCSTGERRRERGRVQAMSSIGYFFIPYFVSVLFVFTLNVSFALKKLWV